MRQCNAVAGDPRNPDVVVFLGWEWTQVGRTPANHYGHKNVIFRGLEDTEVPARTDRGGNAQRPSALRSAASQQLTPLAAFADFPQPAALLRLPALQPRAARRARLPRRASTAATLPADCHERAPTPRELFEKLTQWGFDTHRHPARQDLGPLYAARHHLGQAAHRDA